MARKPREEVVDGVHHVWARGNDRQRIYRHDDDRRLYLALLAVTVAEVGWRLFAFCLMGNHVHLLVQTPNANLGQGMQRLHGGYARKFNDRHGRVGHVFQGRFENKLQRTDEQLLTTVRYIARNPVEAGLCEAADEWPWSSHRGTLDGSAPGWVDRHRLLAFIAAAGGDPGRIYRDLIDG